MERKLLMGVGHAGINFGLCALPLEESRGLLFQKTELSIFVQMCP